MLVMTYFVINLISRMFIHDKLYKKAESFFSKDVLKLYGMLIK